MKTYKITTEHDVFIDSYEEGESKHVNSYSLTSDCKALTVQEAIINHFNNTVYLPFDIKHADIDKEQNLIFYCNLVNVDNEDPTEHELEEWKKGKIELYNNHIVISAQELTNVIF
jgi:hypothetical protein